MPDIENYKAIQEFIKNKNIHLIAVSKTKPKEDILDVYRLGHRDFGENKAQELAAKAPELPDDINWHYIGHLQSNKVKFVVPYAKWIHSVDRIKIANAIQKEAVKQDKTINCLLQIHIADETSKFGFDFHELKSWLNTGDFKKLSHIKLCGVMGMATLTDDQQAIKQEFDFLKQCFKELKSDLFKDNPDFKEISMGMTGDYKIAIQSGSTMLRIGSLIFGERE